MDYMSLHNLPLGGNDKLSSFGYLADIKLKESHGQLQLLSKVS
jgi:hypothetical protein